MTQLLRGKQAGVQNDLSAGLTPDLFVLDEALRYGVNSQVSCVAYDPIQSILAVGTKNSQFGDGQIYLFGQKRVQVTLPLPRSGAGVQALQFCAEKLVCLDSKHDIAVYSLEKKRILASHSPPGIAQVLCSDPTLDYALLGMRTGEILAYDLDREQLTAFRIPNLWLEVDPRARIAPIVSLQFHPRDIGTLLIGYANGAVIYSFKLSKPLRFFHYEIPRGAPGGDGDAAMANAVRMPRLTQATWHPTGTFIMTGHEDGSLVFWDTNKDGRLLMARTLTDTNIATPGRPSGALAAGGSISVKEPLFRLAWCANQDPEDTAILIAGGQSTQSPTKGLTLFEMGRTPLYSTSSWEGLAGYLESPKRQRILPTPPGAEVIDFCLIPRATPHFAGAHDPIAVIAVLSSGELITMTFPSGMPISPTNQLPVSATFVHPFIKRLNSAQVGRERWLGMTERRQQGPQFVKGGAEIPRPMRRFENRTIVQTSYADGSIRLWDVGHGDDIENDKVLQVDVVRAVGHFENVDVTTTSLAGASGELAVGLRSGELIVFRWGTNRNAGRETGSNGPNQERALTNVTDRAEASLNEGLVPATLLDQRDGPATVVCMSEIGFVAAGFEGGSVAIIDMRGPAIIFSGSIKDISKGHPKSGFRRRASNDEARPEWATAMEFSIMMLEDDGYSSISLHVGTNLGRLATFKIVPDPSGRYTVQYAGSVKLDDRIVYMYPMNADSGRLAAASPQAMGGLASGLKIPGVLVAVTASSIHIFKPATSKGAHKSFDSYFCDAAAVVRYHEQGYALLGLFGDGHARAFSLPSLREISAVKLPQLDVRRLANSAITPTGHIIGFAGPSEVVVLNIFGTGEPPYFNQDSVFNPRVLIPPRPTISTVQWVTGTQYMTPADLDILIGGPERPPSKRMLAQARADEQQMRQANSAASSAAGQQEGYWAYMQRQVQERTEKLNLIGDSMNNLEEHSASWAEEVNKFVSKQKKAAVTGRESHRPLVELWSVGELVLLTVMIVVVKSKFGL